MEASSQVNQGDQLAKSQALLQYARDRYRDGHARFEWLEAKAGRYLTILVFVIGSANVVMLIDVRQALFAPNATPLAGAFALGLFSMLVSAVVSLVAALLSMRPQQTPTNSCDWSRVSAAFDSQTLASVSRGEAEQQLKAAERLLKTNERKASLLRLSFACLLTTVGLYGLTLALWFLITPTPGK